MSEIGAVVIGRNEGERLSACLDSVAGRFAVVVYVDSGSRDGSVERARESGADVVELDAGAPFSAARARNAGLARLEARPAPSEHVQFLDGDCVLQPGWLEAAIGVLGSAADVAVACGRRREREPGASPYNRLADLEWDTPIGEAQACGGDALMRIASLRAVGGFDPMLIAGEEPELCLRLRRAGWRVIRVDSEMTLHDANLRHVGPWWRRQVRAGHAYAECYWKHRSGPEGFRRRELRSILAWALGVPVLTALATMAFGPAALAALLVYPLQWLRIAAARPGRHRGLWATGCLVGKFAQLEGALVFAWNRAVRRRPTALMEYESR